MVIVKIQGGLGNQLFQYAFYRKLCTIHKDVKMDITTNYIGGWGHNGYELNKIFPILENYASIKEIETLSKYRNLKIYILLRRYKNILYSGSILTDNLGRNSEGKKLSLKYKLKASVTSLLQLLIIDSKKNSSTYFREDNKKNSRIYFREDRPRVDNFENFYYNKKNAYYDGYWNDKISYFEDIYDIIYKETTFKNPLKGKNKELYDLISNPDNCTVSVHVRRGDFKNTVFDCVSPTYYEKALIEIEKLYCNPIYIIFSDDIAWVKNNLEIFEGKNKIYVSWNKKNKNYIDMQLMSACKHNIIANSTFSWWGAFLNKNDDKTVVLPEYFYKNSKYVDNAVKMPLFPKQTRAIIISNLNP